MELLALVENNRKKKMEEDVAVGEKNEKKLEIFLQLRLKNCIISGKRVF